MDILYQFNEAYAPFAGISITSLFINNQTAERITVWILGENLSDDSIERFKNLALQYSREIRFVNTERLVMLMVELGMPTYRGSYAANMRLFLSEVIDEEIDRILYLDADTVVNADIQSFFSMDMQNYPLAMVIDSLGGVHKRDLGIAKEMYYYNSGVILFKMDEWRKQKLTEAIVNHVQHIRAHYPAPDQDLLNVVCKGKILTLAPKFNFQPIHLAFSIKQYFKVYSRQGYYSEEELYDAQEQISIYHFFRFIGEFPWHKDNCHPDNKIFDLYLKQSLWSDYNKEKAVLSTAIRVERYLYKYLPKVIFLRFFRFFHSYFVWEANKKSLQMKIHKEM